MSNPSKTTYRREYCPKCTHTTKWAQKDYMDYRPGPITIQERGRRGRRAGKPNSVRLINGYFLCSRCKSLYYTVTLKKFHARDIVVEEKHKWEVTNTTTDELGKSLGSGGVS